MCKSFGWLIGVTMFVFLTMCSFWSCAGQGTGDAKAGAAAHGASSKNSAEEKTFTREKLLNDMRKGEFLEARQAIQVCVKRDNMGLVRAALTNPRDDIKLMAAKSLVKDIEVTIEAIIGTLERNADIAEGGDEATIRRELKEGLVRYIGRALGREYALANADSAEEIGKLVKEMRRDLLTPTKGKE